MYMIVSFDVGIKNLAYCLLDKVDGKYTPVRWDVINLCGEPATCSGSTKKGVCGKKAAWTYKGESLCGIHKKTCGAPEAPCDFYKYEADKRMSKAAIETLRKNVGYEGPLIKEDLVQMVTENFVLKEAKGPSANDMDLITISRLLPSRIGGHVDPEKVEHLLIENQISPLAGRMKVIQGMITQFFVDKAGDVKIEYVSSANKLKDFDVPKRTYADRKKSGIEVTRKIMADDERMAKWYTTFESHSKKDDLADAYLQAAWYIRKNDM